MRRFVVVLLAGICMAIGGALPAGAAPSPLIVENSFLRVTIKGVAYRLQALVVKEAGRGGRLPVALITHGVSADLERRQSVDAVSYMRIARDFARRGWLAAVVVRRGFGQSGMISSGAGSPDDRQAAASYTLRGCRNGDYATALDEQTDDVEAALAAVADRADADSARKIVVGVSVGGAVALNLAARAPAGLRAVVNVSGGVGSRPRPGAQPSCRPEHLLPVFAGYGAASRLPTLWLYAENDSLFPANYVRDLHQAYAAAGGRSEFHMFEAIGKDGHNIFTSHDGLLRWLPVLDKFLRQQNLPTFDPRPLDSTWTVLKLPRAARGLIARYHGRPTEKAFAVSQSGKHAHVTYGAATIDDASAKSVAACEKVAKESCRVVLLNFEVVDAP